MFTTEELFTLLIWICGTAIGALLIGFLTAIFIVALATAKQSGTKPDWGTAIMLSLILFVPSVMLIWHGIQNNIWNILVVVVCFCMAAVAGYIGWKDNATDAKHRKKAHPRRRKPLN